MIYFRSDYSQGAHPEVLDALVRTNMEHTDGYGMDEHCKNAEKMIKELIGTEDCSVHMMVGGTPCNITFIASALRPYESVIAARTGHIYSHETGGVEGTGHRIVTVPGENGKLRPVDIDQAYSEYEDEHTVLPGMVYISQPTELGSLYSKQELTDLYAKCKEKNLYLYVDGARLGSALTSSENDLSIKELATLCDAFYIGGTKNGALFGEALVIKAPEINEHFRYMMKRQCGLLAKGRLIGVQFEALLQGGENSLYYRIAAKANEYADMLRSGLKEMGISFVSRSATNQLFPILPTKVVKELERDFFFYEWAPEKDGKTAIRLVTGWGTERDDVENFLGKLKKLLNS